MKKSLFACVAAVCGAATAGHYEFVEDFTVRDDRNRAVGLDIEENTAYSHGHGWILPDKAAYGIFVNGNRHFLRTPKLADFELSFEYDFRLFEWNGELGYTVFYRWDRETRRGDALSVFHDKDRKLHVTVNGREVFVRQDDEVAALGHHRVRLAVDGEKGMLDLDGVKIPFGAGTGRAGAVGLDMTFSPSSTMEIGSLRLTSDTAPERRKLRDWRFELSREQGAENAYCIDVTAWRYATGETEFDCTLGGGIAADRKRLETGGKEWSRVTDRLTDPYLRIDARSGEVANVYFYNGLRQYVSPHAIRGKTPANPPWPVRRTLLFRALPEEFTLAAGYGKFISTPSRFAEGGPFEQIRDATGKRIYEGESVRGACVAVRIAPLPGGKVAKSLPKDLPRYAEARAHAEKGGYFRESEPIAFTVEALYRPSFWEKSELKVEPQFLDVYGEPLPGLSGAYAIEEKDVETRPDGLCRVTYEVALRARQKPGVWKVRVKHASPSGRTEKTFIYEVLSDVPGGPCPPVISGLPRFFSMPNEVKCLETNAFDPWNPFCGAQHYYFCDNVFPLVGWTNQVWRALPAYDRGWWCWNWDRNSDRLDPRDPWCRDLMRNSRWFMCCDPDANYLNRWDLGVVGAYSKAQLKILRQFVCERRPALKRLSLERIDALIAEKKGIEFEDLRDLFDTCWEDWVAYARAEIAARTAKFTDELLSVNPKMGLASYGPYAVYVARYKTAYQLKYSGYDVEKDPRVRANDSFWVFEEYHHSCDYPLYRGALFVASYDYYYDYGRRIYPEIYYSGWTRCSDGAVFQAHPGKYSWVRDSHQSKIAYRYVYGTPQFRNGSYKFWRDDGFHARNPEKQAMETFLRAWGNTRRHRPAASARAPFLMLDLEQIGRHGDYFDDETNTRYFGISFSDICNTAEEGLAYAYEKAIDHGYTTPVLARLDELDAITPEMAEFVILPPIVAGTPERHLAAIRRAWDRGVGLFCSEACEGLEDIFGVRKSGAWRTVGHIGDESFQTRLSVARYEAAGADVALWGGASVEAPHDIPVVFHNRNEKVRAVFVNIPTASVRKNSFRENFHWGSDSLSRTMHEALAGAYAFLSPAPQVKTERGSVMAVRAEGGELVVVLGDESPIYNDPTEYPVSFRFTVAEPGIGGKAVFTDSAYEIVERSEDRLVMRTSLDKDASSFFVFADPERKCTGACCH